MRITQWGEYGILISAYLAARQENGVAPVVGAAEIADAQEIALQYAQQILLRLRDGAIVESVRGPHGGYRLAKPLSEISLLDILLAAEGTSFEVICETKPLSLTSCKEHSPCFLQDVWLGLRVHVDEYLAKHTLAQVVAGKNHLVHSPSNSSH
jgi:Rrf2 family transcriptional regulator, iron-sulfur cluster assembly transcription factor